ncbi:B12-binding domain-containing radical SAM protein [Actinoplanes sp. NPDC023936]|uniref:B12-binding domain-containing radical SAM protein n=1 Tax=Actinoplanes sp. NPDC023936 TaxID=3154910 RepID=UPI0033D477DC
MASTTAVVFVLPPSPSDTNPPLGPAILAREARKWNGAVVVRDLNIDYIRQFEDRDSVTEKNSAALGDQGKDRKLAATAASALYRQFALDPAGAMFVPDVATAEAGMHFSGPAINHAIEQHVSRGSDLAAWISHHLDECQAELGTPGVVGVSLMGPSQVFASLLLLRLAKSRWRHSVTAAGGSHVTLLTGTAEGAAMIRQFADVTLPGHSEHEFTHLLTGRRSPSSDEFDYEPHFEPGQLARYRQSTLVLPVQFSRGCLYGKCTFCTYPVVEPVATRIDAARATAALRHLSERHGVSRFSLKDSLVPAKDLLALAQAVHADGLEVVWSATTLPRRTLATMAAELAGGGLRTLEFGVESIHPANQQLMRKRSSPDEVEWMVEHLARAGIVSVVNLMFGFPGETQEQAAEQLAWAASLKQRHPGAVDFSLNMLEVVRGSPMERDTGRFGILGVAPWAYAYEWTPPPWRPEFAPSLLRLERR